MKALYIILSLLLLVGCASNTALNKQATINKEKLSVVSQISYQIQHTTNSVIAKLYTDKLVNLVGEPNLTDTKTTNFDKIISKIQTAEDKNQLAIESQADKAERLQIELNKYKSYWGIGGIVLGVKEFITHSLWWLFGFSVVFFVLRIAAATNPIANLFFGIFQQIAASGIHLIESIVPHSIPIITQAQNDVTTVSNAVIQTVESPNVSTPQISTNATGST